MEAGQGGDKKNTFAQKIAPLAQKITEYINDHQDDAAQEDRWRTIMKRDTMKRFQKLGEAIDKQHKAIAEQVREAVDKQRDTSEMQGKAIAEQVSEAVDKQRDTSDTQGKAIAEVREAVDKQREAIVEVRELIMELTNAYTPTSVAMLTPVG